MTELQSLKNDGLDWSAAPPGGSTIISPQDAFGSIAPAPAPASGAPAASANPLGAASSFFSSPFASVGVEYGKNLIANNTVLNSGVGGWVRGSRLRYYFQVTQSYIGKKIAKILLPYIHYDWTRQPLEEVDQGLVAAASSAAPGATWKPASKDINAPDLYIGLMSFLTFIVTMGFALGMADKFDPEMLGITASRSIICIIFEVAIIYTGFYLSDAPVSPAVLDLVALTGYKYVVLNLDILIGILFGPTVFWIAFVVLGVSTVVFMVRTLNGWVPASGSALGTNPNSPKFRGLLIGFAVLQLIVSLFLLYPALPAVHQHGVVGRWSSAVTSTPLSVGEQPKPVEEIPQTHVQEQEREREQEQQQPQEPVPITPTEAQTPTPTQDIGLPPAESVTPAEPAPVTPVTEEPKPEEAVKPVETKTEEQPPQPTPKARNKLKRGGKKDKKR